MLTIVAAIDDATGTVPYALFREQEDAHGYFLLLQGIIQRKGIPLALYSDRHGIFLVNRKQTESLDEQLAGERHPTQFGRALQQLGIQSILAHSPQAKGRIERMWGTFQDRLVAELRLAGVTTMQEANQVLWGYLPRFNTRFGVPAANSGSAYRPTPTKLDLASVLCFQYQRTVAKDNTVRLGEHTLQLLPGPERTSYARARVQIQERLDGSLVVTYQGRVIGSRPAPPNPMTLRARSTGVRLALPAVSCQLTGPEPVVSPSTSPTNGSSEPRTPAPDHPWRKPSKVTKS